MNQILKLPSLAALLLFTSAQAQEKKSLSERLQWSLQLPNVEENGAPAKQNGIVASRDGSSLWMTTQKGFLYGVNATDGTILATHQPFPWAKTTESKPVLCEKTHANGTSTVEYVVYAISDGRVIAVNPTTGLERWMMYSEYCTPTQPVLSDDCRFVYYTCNKRHVNEAELFVVDDAESTKEFMGIPHDQVTRQGEKLGPIRVGYQSTRSSGAMFLYFGSYKDDENTTTAEKRLAMGGGSTLRYNTLDQSLEELSILSDGIQSPVGVSRDEKAVWAQTYDSDTTETTVHGIPTSQESGQLRSTSESSSWTRNLGPAAQEFQPAPLSSHDESHIYVSTGKSVYKLATQDGAVAWDVSDLNLKAAPVLRPLDSTRRRRNLADNNPTTLYVMEDTGGRVWKVNTENGDMTMEANCLESATCAMASHADFTTSPDGSTLYIALKTGIVYALETTEPFAAATPPAADTPPTEGGSQESAAFTLLGGTANMFGLAISFIFAALL